MVKESSLETTPGLIALIDNPTEEDLLKVIYSDKVTLDIIKELPDKSITPRVATIALCLEKRWSNVELLVWFNKFIPYVNPKDYLKVFINIEDKLPDSSLFHQKDWDLFIALFSKVDNPPRDLIDFYLKTCVEYSLLGLKRYPHIVDPKSYVYFNANVFLLNVEGLTSSLKGILDNKQEVFIYSHLIPNHENLGASSTNPISLDVVSLENEKGLKKLSLFISKKSCDDISSILDDHNKPAFALSKKTPRDDIKDTNNSTKKASLWEGISKVFKS